MDQYTMNAYKLEEDIFEGHNMNRPQEEDTEDFGDLFDLKENAPLQEQEYIHKKTA